MNRKNNNFERCVVCPRACGVNRYKTSSGICGMKSEIFISSAFPHFGEESVLVGNFGSGTIFFTGCNLKCKFCQNFEISHHHLGEKIEKNDLIDLILNFQEIGCSNVNLVTPTHFSPALIDVIIEAKSRGLVVPVIYNSSGYDKVDTLKDWNGLIDIYMPDLKFKDKRKSILYTESPDYFEIASQAVLEMFNQVGSLVVKNGRAKRGLLIRHLVMPNGQSDTSEIIDFIVNEIGNDTSLNLMDQYYPHFDAYCFTEINRIVSKEEYMFYRNYAIEKGMINLL